MNYKLETTANGKRWIKQVWDTEQECVVETPLELGEKLVLDPEDFVNSSSVFLFKDSEYVTEVDESGEPVSLEEFIDKLVEEVGQQEFVPRAFYNRDGDGIQLYWKDAASVCQWNPGFDIHRECIEQDEGEVIGVNIWGIKRILLEAYANCDEPRKFLSVMAFNPDSIKKQADPEEE